MAFREDVDYQELINKAVEQGDYRAAAQYEQTRNEKINALNERGGGTNQYGAEVTNNYRQYLMPENYTGSSYGVGVHNADQTAIRDQMNSNSIAWWSADDATRAQLEQQNQQLAGQLGGGVTFDEASGYWSGTADKPASTSAPTFDYGYYASTQPTYESSYSAKIDELLNQILNRDSFSYNAEEDPLYQQYREQYNREGQRAMNDTLAAAASGAGGMNSYAITAASQANDYYASQLGDKIPELYQLAYQMYLDDIDMQVQDLGLVQQMDNTQYGRYRDTMSDWRDDRDFAYGAYRDDVGDWQWNQNFEYNAGRDFVNDQRYENEWEYGVGRDEISDSRYESEQAYDRAIAFLNSGVMPDSAVLQAAGISSAEAERILAAQQLSSTGSSSSSSTGGGGGYDYTNGGMSKDEIIAIQKELGVTADGLWGPATQAAYEAKYGTGTPDNPLAGLLGGDDEEADAPAPGEDKELYAAIDNLGIGPAPTTLVAELQSYGGIKEQNGKFVWSNGWNKDNYETMLKIVRDTDFELRRLG